MPKLLTPVQYEPSLEGLNVVRPLHLADEAKPIISYPVLCKNPPTKDRPVVGKLARCTQQGALASDKRVVYDTWEYIEKQFTWTTRQHHIAFSQVVYPVHCNIVSINLINAIAWTDSTYTKIYQLLDLVVDTMLWFKGVNLYIRTIMASPPAFLTLGFYGFY